MDKAFPTFIRLWGIIFMKKEKCYLCTSTAIHNPTHSVNEVPLCEGHYNAVISVGYDSYNVTTIPKECEAGIIKTGRTFGVELESHAPTNLNMRVALALLPRGFGSHVDGTIRHPNAQEITTCPLRGAKGEKTLSDYCTVLTEELGWNVTPTCGTHCHIGVPEFANYESDENVKSRLRLLVIMYTIFDPVIRCLLPIARRNCNYCAPLGMKFTAINKENGELHPFHAKTKEFAEIGQQTTDPEALEYRKKNNYAGIFSRYGINFAALYEHKTIEIRYHQGTLDPVMIIHWIALHSAIIELCMSGGITEENLLEFTKVTDVFELLKNLLDLCNQYLDPSTVEYTINRFNLYKKSNPTDGYISEYRYDPKDEPTYERVIQPQEKKDYISKNVAFPSYDSLWR